MSDSEDENKKEPINFKEILNQAAYLKGEQLKLERTKYDKYPCYIQHSLFYQEDKEIRNCNSLKNKLDLGYSLKEDGNNLFKVFKINIRKVIIEIL